MLGRQYLVDQTTESSRRQKSIRCFLVHHPHPDGRRIDLNKLLRACCCATSQRNCCTAASWSSSSRTPALLSSSSLLSGC